MWVENRGDASMGLPRWYNSISAWCEDSENPMCYVSWKFIVIMLPIPMSAHTAVTKCIKVAR